MLIENIILKSSFKTMRGFNFAHINPGSLLSNFDEFKNIFKDVPLDLIAISESWLKNKHNDALVNLPGYNFLRKDRHGRRVGGVLTYIKSTVKFNIVTKNAPTALFDMMFIEISLTSGSKLLVGIVYIPPKIKFLDQFSNVLANYVANYNDIIILGDFNIDILSNGNHANNLKLLFNRHGLSLASDFPTNFSKNNCTCIDLLKKFPMAQSSHHLM